MYEEARTFDVWRRERLPCPRCGAPAVHVVWGLPTEKATAAAATGDLVLGGCMPLTGEPEWMCPACDRAFSASGAPMASDLTWEDCGYFPTCAFAALGDTELVGESAWLRSGGLPYLHVRPDGLGVLYGKAECDGLPIELGSKGGHVVAARVEFTNDVAEVESAGTGRLVTRGRMRIGSHGAIAFDDHDSVPNPVPLPLPAGWYLAQVFEHDGDHLGIRLVADVRP